MTDIITPSDLPPPIDPASAVKAHTKEGFLHGVFAVWLATNALSACLDTVQNGLVLNGRQIQAVLANKSLISAAKNAIKEPSPPPSLGPAPAEFLYGKYTTYTYSNQWGLRSTHHHDGKHDNPAYAAWQAKVAPYNKAFAAWQNEVGQLQQVKGEMTVDIQGLRNQASAAQGAGQTLMTDMSDICSQLTYQLQTWFSLQKKAANISRPGGAGGG